MNLYIVAPRIKAFSTFLALSFIVYISGSTVIAMVTGFLALGYCVDQVFPCLWTFHHPIFSSLFSFSCHERSCNFWSPTIAQPQSKHTQMLYRSTIHLDYSGIRYFKDLYSYCVHNTEQ